MPAEAEVLLKTEEAEAHLEVQHLGAMTNLDLAVEISEETISGTEVEEITDTKTTVAGLTTHLEIPVHGRVHLETLGKIRATIGLVERVDGLADITTPLEEWILVLSRAILEDQ